MAPLPAGYTAGCALVAGIAGCGDVADRGKRVVCEGGGRYNDPAGPIKEVRRSSIFRRLFASESSRIIEGIADWWGYTEVARRWEAVE
jgi:hypothetical protein